MGGYRVPHANLYYARRSLTAPLPVLIQIAAARPRRSAEEPVEREQVNRRMAAILAADVAGYSRLMGTDEEGTHARLKAHRRELIDPKIKERHGRIVKTTGDGILIEFPSVVDAVRCAVEVQQGMAQRNTDMPDGQRIVFRVGINLGDVIVEGKDIYGDGVNIAARLEGRSEEHTSELQSHSDLVCRRLL